ncbi:hypothetical protein V6N12_061780 [Hibiscus sabdariffa]|uniref:Uncharacterized protein n=1 Tax=Hibiscus sabdariffa TaxID=183260 RepID=A0ABR2DY23_9ROSI
MVSEVLYPAGYSSAATAGGGSGSAKPFTNKTVSIKSSLNKTPNFQQLNHSSSSTNPSSDSSVSVTASSVTRRNQHHMATRSKSGVFKPKALYTELNLTEPKNVHQAMNTAEWRDE